MFVAGEEVLVCLQVDAEDHGYNTLLVPVTGLISASVSRVDTVATD